MGLTVGLNIDPFDQRVTADGRVFVTRRGRRVAVVAGARGAKLIAVVEQGGDEVAQQALAPPTGNYRRGNERP